VVSTKCLVTSTQRKFWMEADQARARWRALSRRVADSDSEGGGIGLAEGVMVKLPEGVAERRSGSVGLDAARLDEVRSLAMWKLATLEAVVPF
jgi:hypothetical protein